MMIFRNILLAMATTLLLSEIFLRLFIISPEASIPDSEFGWVYRPNATILHSSEGYARNTINSYGYNDDEPRENTAEIKVVALGDSFTEALHVPYDTNFTSVSENISCVDVFNAGRSGMEIIHYPIVFKRLEESLHFDHAVMVLTQGDVGFNRDIISNISYDESGEHILNIQVKEQGLSPMRRLLGPLFSNSSVATLLKNRFKQMTAASPGNEADQTDSEPSEEETENTRRATTYAMEAINSRVSLSILYIPSYEYLADRQAMETSRSITASQLVETVSNTLGIPFKRVEGLAAAYRDTGKPPTGFPNKNIRGGHLNDLGHTATAEALIQLVNPQCAI